MKRFKVYFLDKSEPSHNISPGSCYIVEAKNEAGAKKAAKVLINNSYACFGGMEMFKIVLVVEI